MATAKLTLIGLYNYDETLFDGLQLPEYFEKATLVKTILLTGGEFGCLYPSPDFMKTAIKLWSDKNQRYFERMAILMEKEYEPLENYNRQEKWHDAGTSEAHSEFTSGSDTVGKVSAFNSSAFENRDKTENTDSGENDGTNEYSVDREGYARGNIGVMSSQDMFRQELDIIGLSPYDLIANDFINEFCIKVYV